MACLRLVSYTYCCQYNNWTIGKSKLKSWQCIVGVGSSAECFSVKIILCWSLWGCNIYHSHSVYLLSKCVIQTLCLSKWVSQQCTHSFLLWEYIARNRIILLASMRSIRQEMWSAKTFICWKSWLLLLASCRITHLQNNNNKKKKITNCSNKYEQNNCN